MIKNQQAITPEIARKEMLNHEETRRVPCAALSDPVVCFC